MQYIRKVRPGRSIHLAGSSCTTTRLLVAEAAWGPLEAILEALGGCSMHDPASELRRIPLPRTPMNREVRSVWPHGIILVGTGASEGVARCVVFEPRTPGRSCSGGGRRAVAN